MYIYLYIISDKELLFLAFEQQIGGPNHWMFLVVSKRLLCVQAQIDIWKIFYKICNL